MPLLYQAHASPSLKRVAETGSQVIEHWPDSGTLLNIGLLNMMPGRALAATERQFLRLLDSHEARCCTLSLFRIQGIPYHEETIREHLDTYYTDCRHIADTPLDALIITGANITEPDLTHESFWQELQTTLEQAHQRQLPVICSCLAAHASALIFHGITRRRLQHKCWGIFEHALRAPKHPLLADLPQQPILMPHSRFNEISEDSFRAHDIDVLIAGDRGVQMAVDGEQRIYFQGHPEYEAISLLKEYKREVLRYLNAEREDYPPMPEHTFPTKASDAALQFRQQALTHSPQPDLIEHFPEAMLTQHVGEPWKETSKLIYRNWLDALA